MIKGSQSDRRIFHDAIALGQLQKKCFSKRGIYKNPEAFYCSLSGVCYIPELAGRRYTGANFLELSLGQKEIAEEMFLSIDGQDPESWLDEQFRIGELAICPVCNRIYQSYMAPGCPLCWK
ncbi:hypothetical protein H171_3706 [[Clostridium] celerecrescens 18A]|uniref:Uncharacterized protein n=1 Tax=[Clostridium] celerecrescens 18A TaxID=1286362 RepID=A0A2M8Z9M6_9FIRM|nr:hypothetical protein H171_3706 [[Clostridium] celerecrescens 18A]